jgi:hypothetical protein
MQTATVLQPPDRARALHRPEPRPGTELKVHDPASRELRPHPPEEFPEHQLALVRGGDVIARATSVPVLLRGFAPHRPTPATAGLYGRPSTTGPPDAPPPSPAPASRSSRATGAPGSAPLARAPLEAADGHRLTAHPSSAHPDARVRRPYP